MATMNGILGKMLAQDAWGKRAHPRLTVGKIAGGLTVKPLGLLAAFEVQGKAQWSRIYDPREMTELDEKRYKKLQSKARALAKQMRRLEEGAFERGYPVNIDRIVKITNERERIGGR